MFIKNRHNLGLLAVVMMSLALGACGENKRMLNEAVWALQTNRYDLFVSRLKGKAQADYSSRESFQELRAYLLPHANDLKVKTVKTKNREVIASTIALTWSSYEATISAEGASLLRVLIDCETRQKFEPQHRKDGLSASSWDQGSTTVDWGEPETQCAISDIQRL